MNNTKSLFISILATLSISALAGWEDIGVARPVPQTETRATAAKPTRTTTSAPARSVRKTQPQPAPRPVSKPASGAYLLPPDLYSTFLDASRAKPNWAGFTYIAPSDADKTGEEFSEIVLEGSFEITTLEDVLSGDLSLSVDPAITFFPNDAGADDMPTMLVKIAADIDWTWRYINGWSFEIGATPGIYADIDGFGGSMFGIPFRGIFYYAFDPTLSIKLGLECRPGWDQLLMPHLGLAWQPDDMFRLELALPKTTANINIGVVDLFGKIEWLNTTYGMSGDKQEPDDITLNEWKLGGGLGFNLGDSWRLVLEGGLMFGREITARKGSKDSSSDVDSTLYFGASLGWDL